MNLSLAEQAHRAGAILSPTEVTEVASVLPTRGQFRAFHGQRFALIGNPEHFLKWLLLLDGIAESIYLLPAESSYSNISELLTEHRLIKLDSAPTPPYCSGLIQQSEASAPDPANPFSAADRNYCPSVPFPTLQTNLFLPTSGTTGKPKFVAHTVERLTCSFRKQSLSEKFRWGMLYDPARFAGLQVLLQGILCGDILLAPTPGWELPRKMKWLVQQSCNALSATPSLWRQILACPASHQLSLVQITLGGEICDAAILGALRMRFPTARITQIYASTEAGVVFSVHDGQPGFPAPWLKAGVKDCQLRIAEDETLEVARTSATGEANWLNTGDIVEQVGDRVLFKGRKSGLINVGGNKVYPEEVEATVALVEGVESVLVSARTSSMMGSLLEAQVVPTASAPPDLSERIRLYCKQVLPRFKQPAFIKIVSELATNSNGKRVRREST
jgi:acyl-CoA synthetase (AMP-forming)/AMP-acid ligase II